MEISSRCWKSLWIISPCQEIVCDARDVGCDGRAGALASIQDARGPLLISIFPYFLRSSDTRDWSVTRANVRLISQHQGELRVVSPRASRKQRRIWVKSKPQWWWGLKGVCRKRLVLNRERDVDGLPTRPMLRVERVNRVMGCYRDLNLSIQSWTLLGSIFNSGCLL